MTMHRARSAAPALVLGALVALSGSCGQQAAEVEAPGNGGMTPMGNNGGNSMPGSMNPSSNGGGGNATLKFCNAIKKDSGDVTVELVIGSLRVQAPSGKCTPDCREVPAGNARLVFNMDGKEILAKDIGLESGGQYLVISTVELGSQKIGVGGGKLRSGASCANENPFPASSGPNGGGGGPGAGGPVATAGKFCHSLGRQGGMPVTFTLSVGGVQMTATTQGCSTPSGTMCQGLKAGKTTAELSVDGQAITSSEVTLENGREYLFELDLDPAGAPVIKATPLASGVACATAKPTAGGGSMPPPGPSPPPGGTIAEVKLCNRLPVMGGKNVAALEIGPNLTLTAMPGTCAPVKGMACGMVPAGLTDFNLVLDGVDIGSAQETLPAGASVLEVRMTDAGQLGLRRVAVPAGMMCSQFESM